MSSCCLARRSVRLFSLRYSTCRCHLTTLNVLPWKRKNEFSFILLSCICRCQRRTTHLGLHIRYSICFLYDFNRTRILLADIDTSPRYKILLKSVPCGWTERWTYHYHHHQSLLCRVFTVIYPKQTMFLGSVVLLWLCITICNVISQVNYVLYFHVGAYQSTCAVPKVP